MKLVYETRMSIPVRLSARGTLVKSAAVPLKPVALPSRAPSVGFPYSNVFDINGRQVDAETVISLLQPFLSEDRMKRITKVVSERTFSVLPVVEGLYDMGNLAAVCRSADALGYGAIHCVKKSTDLYKQSHRTSAGADKWLDVTTWESTQECAAAMKQAGYKLLVTHLSRDAIHIKDVDWSQPTAVVLGNEQYGVSDEMVAAADACIVIPMSGFVESFNISVAAALVLYEAQQQRIRALGKHGDLNAEEQQILQAVMMACTVREPRTLLHELLSRPPPSWQGSKFKKFSFDVQDQPITTTDDLLCPR